ncbi:hypothetical protein [Capybara microvirus Cap1_SP_244]|nr:hypothetical protein [Capybara microvirus Cap1_SP_244]
MNFRSLYNWKPEKLVEISSPIKEDYEIEDKIVCVNKDNEVYKHETIFKKKVSKWADYIESFSIGTPQDQVSALKFHGRPLMTSDTLPHGDYSDMHKTIENIKKIKNVGINNNNIDDVEKLLLKSTEIETPKGGE